MEFEIVGWPGDGATIDLDHRRFSYAGKFVMSRSGKAVVRHAGDVIAAASFSEDRTDSEVMCIRYITVRDDIRGQGIGPRLAAQLRHRFDEKGYGSVRIAVNNPYAFRAMGRAGFGFTGETTGIAELVLSSVEPIEHRYRAGLARFQERNDLEDEERAFVETASEKGPPSSLEPPVDWSAVTPSP